jgi:hypothetical protein
MKRTIIFILFFLKIFFIDFTLKFIFLVNIIDINFINKIEYIFSLIFSSNNKIRFLNLIVFIVIIIVYFYFDDFKRLRLFKKVLVIFLFLITTDYLSGFVNFGYKKSEYDTLRQIFPYDWIRGKPNRLDHNEFGFRGKSPNIIRDKDKFIIGFFGGSTGYNGNPPIIEIVSKKLNEINLDSEIINFSSVSSNHNQHLHRLLEFSEFTYDLIIFYGGGNETIQHYYYDPRPGYPYNFYLFDGNRDSFLTFFTKYSNFVGEIDKLFNLYLDFNPLILDEIDYKIWVNKTKNNYFNTIKKTKNLSEKILKPNRCNKTLFLPIFQPLKPPNVKTQILVESLEKDLEKYEIYDFSNLESQLTFIDFIHIDQKSKKIVSNQIFNLVKEIFENKKNC